MRPSGAGTFLRTFGGGFGVVRKPFIEAFLGEIAKKLGTTIVYQDGSKSTD